MLKKIMVVVIALIMVSSFTIAASASDVVAYPGDQGALVSALQKALKDRGYFSAEITGYYGEITKSAVLQFQKDNGLNATGSAVPLTCKMLGVASSTTSTSSTAASNVASLSVGDTGASVTALQNALKAKGFFSINATGYFGALTENAVMDFQKTNGLEVCGIAGPKTQALLGTAGTATTSSATTKTSAIVISRQLSDDRGVENWVIRGDEGSDVTAIQQRLQELGYYTYGITGFYGPITEDAVSSFQSKNGLVVSGIVGDYTRSVMFSNSALSASSAGAKTQATGSVDYSTSTVTKLINYAKSFLGVPYVYGANGPNSFDCTGFTTYVFRYVGVNSLPRTAQEQGYSNYGVKITSISALKPGDLVFFDTIADSDLCDHAGIYIGNNQFIHANSGSASMCVVISSLTGYWKTNFSWGRRVL